MTSRRARAAVRLVRCVAHGFHGLFVVLWCFPRLDVAQRRERIRWWSARLLRLLDVALRVEGQVHQGAILLTANHVSWLDIMAIHTVCPTARFVSKADVKAWPLLGRLVDAGGTLYLERERKRDALRVLQLMAQALAAGDTVAVFPEGTTSDGRGLLPFHANLLQAAITTAVPVQPVALRYSDASHAVSWAVEFVGRTTLLQSLWRVAGAEHLCVRIHVLTPVSSQGADRRMLAELLREQIASALERGDSSTTIQR